MRTRILTVALVILMIGIAGPVPAQAPAQPTNAGPVQPWGLPPLPAGVGPVEKFADIHDTPQGQFLEGGSFDTQGNLWFVGIGSGWISYLQPDGKLVPVVNCNPPAEIGQTCERWKCKTHVSCAQMSSKRRSTASEPSLRKTLTNRFIRPAA